eukprot:3713243-Rhodomonas_salina.4
MDDGDLSGMEIEIFGSNPDRGGGWIFVQADHTGLIARYIQLASSVSCEGQLPGWCGAIVHKGAELTFSRQDSGLQSFRRSPQISLRHKPGFSPARSNNRATAEREDAETQRQKIQQLLLSPPPPAIESPQICRNLATHANPTPQLRSSSCASPPPPPPAPGRCAGCETISCSSLHCALLPYNSESS